MLAPAALAAIVVNKPIGPAPKIATVSPNRTSPSDSVNINQYQEKETEVPHKDISESKSDKIMQEESQKKMFHLIQMTTILI